jgi:hypothetical protein
MANLIDITYFVNDISLPVDTQTAQINAKIRMYEPIILTDVLGYDLYKKMLAGPTDQKYLDLINGKEYKAEGVYYNWRGLVNANKDSLIAYYVWIKFVQADKGYVSGSGVKQLETENSKVDMTNSLITLNYNKMVNLIDEMNAFINANIEEYPTFQQSNFTKFLYLL